MSGFRPIDSKREEFRKYLERAGVMDALTKVLVMLYEEPDKPEDALEYVRNNLGDKRPSVAEIDVLKTDLEAAHIKIRNLEEENAELKRHLRGEESFLDSEAGDRGEENERGESAEVAASE